jgi:transcriptional regulator with XRE-family HTH domain
MGEYTMEYYLGEKIKKLRREKNWSQKDLASKINKSVSTISGYESDAHPVPFDVLVTIAQLVGVSLDELVGLGTSESLSLDGLTEPQIQLMRKLRKEFLNPTSRGNDFGYNKMSILHDLLKLFYD